MIVSQDSQQTRAAVSDASPVSQTVVAGAPFAVLGLAQPLVRALVEEEYSVPTPVQIRAIPPALEGRDLLARAQTGTGKTAAFLLPMLQNLSKIARNPSDRAPRALVLSPTRELAAQIGERASAYSKYVDIRHTVIYGGVSQRAQEGELRRSPDLIIATPGRLLDLVQQRAISLASVEILVLDEADRMLDMGFIRDVKRLLTAMKSRRQTLFFSATLPPDIQRLAAEMLKSPAMIDITPEAAAAPSVTHSVWHVPNDAKRRLIEQVLQKDGDRRAIVFTRTKRGANRVCENLISAGFEAAVIHGNKSQNARDRALDGFRSGTTRVLVATDIAARGIDVEDVGLVVNYDIPVEAESYVHRIGRAGRAGNTGAAVSFCDPSERSYLSGIERLLNARIPVATPTAEEAAWMNARPTNPQPAENRDSGNRNSHRGGGRPSSNGHRPRPNGGGGGASRSGSGHSSNAQRSNSHDSHGRAPVAAAGNTGAARPNPSGGRATPAPSGPQHSRPARPSRTAPANRRYV